MMILGNMLRGVPRCPHCGIANPLLQAVFRSKTLLIGAATGKGSRWGLYMCTSCGDAVAAKGVVMGDIDECPVETIFPEPPVAHEDVPEPARSYLQQAFETLHAPDAAAVMSGAAVDAMLKLRGFRDGTLYHRIDQAVENHVLTKEMGEWAHSVRLGSNRPRHADEENPHLTPEEAEHSVEFAEALGDFLFVLSTRIERGIKDAQGAE